MIARSLVILVSSMCIQYLVAVNPFLGGGNTGNDNVPSVSGTANTSKLLAGIDCTRVNSSSPLLETAIYIHENDTNFNNTNGLLNGTTVQYTCQHMNVTAWKAGIKQRMTADGCNLTRLDSSFGSNPITPTDVDERTHYSNFSFNATSGTVPCGGEQDGTEFSFIVLCFRDENIQKAFDAAFQLTCDNNTATVRTLDANAGVGSPPVINATYAANVTWRFLVYDNVSVSNISDDYMRVNTSLDGVSVVPPGGVALGSVIRIELCLYIDTSRGDTRWYFQDGAAPIGLFGKNTKISNVESDNPISPGFPREVNATDSNGCSLNMDPGAMGAERPSFTYLQPNGANQTKFYLISPNCFMSRWIEVASFVTQNRRTSTLNFTIELEYCLTTALDSNGVNECFGNVTSTDDQLDGYQNCSGVGVGTGRKRRSASNSIANEFNLPSDMQASVTLINPNFVEEPEAPVTQEITQECFENETFTILTACLAFLLAIVLLMAVFLACRIQSARRASVKGSSSSDYTSGYTSGYTSDGYSNKGYKTN